jgi:flavodoxin
MQHTFIWLVAVVSVFCGSIFTLGFPPTSAMGAEVSGNKTLIIYYSRTGNTKAIAEQIQKKTGGDIVELRVAPPYSENYSVCIEEFKRERDTGKIDRKLKNDVNMEQYQVIFLGYPIWGGGIPGPVTLLLQQHDWSGKTIVPFCSHGGGGIGRSVSAITALCPQSEVLEALAVYYDGGGSLENDIASWLRRNGMTN